MPAYDQHAHPSIKRLWKSVHGGDHELSSHPVLSKHGEELSSSSYEHSHGLHKARANPMTLSSLLMEIMVLEEPHQEELIRLAKKVTRMVWNIPEEMLDAGFGGGDGEGGDDIDFNDTEEYLNNEQEDEGVDPREVHKRMTLNMYSHGSAVHAMMSVHHMVNEEINQISPELLEKYTSIASGSHAMYWLIDWDQVMSMLRDMKAGSVSVEYGDEDDEYEADAGNITIKARGMIFPILVQELFKGVAEVISHHALADFAGPQATKILKDADKVEHEIPFTQVGPEMWRRLLKAIPDKSKLADIYKTITMLPPDDLHKLVDLTMQSPDAAMRFLQDRMRDDFVESLLY